MGTFIFSKKQGGFFPFSPHLLGLTPRHFHAGRRPRPSAAAAAESGEGPRWREATSGKFGQRPPCPALGSGRRNRAEMRGTGLPEGRQAVARAGKGEAGPKPPASSPHCRSQLRRRLGPGVRLLRCWRSRAPCRGLGGRLRGRTGSIAHRSPRGESPGFAVPLPEHREKFSHNLSAERNGLAAACLPSIPIVEDCQLPLRQWTERDSGSGALVLPPEKCITDRSHSQGAHCRRWFQHPRPERAAPGTGLRRRTGLPRSSPATTRLSPVVIAPQQPSGSWRRFWSEAPCAGLVLDDVPQPDARGAGSRAATPARERDREWQKDMRL